MRHLMHSKQRIIQLLQPAKSEEQKRADCVNVSQSQVLL
jgi:hypothetical protein